MTALYPVKNQFSKIGLFLLFFVFSLQTSHGQTYGNAFFKFDNALNDGDGFSKFNNFAGDLVWGESYILMAYMAMYRSTGNLYYLRKVITHSKSVMSNRDDMKNWEDYRGVSGATWLDVTFTLNRQPYAWIVDSGMITFGMADFAQLVINTPELHDEVSDEGTTFLEDANWLVERIAETIDAHEDQWDTEDKAYRFRDGDDVRPLLGDITGHYLPHNMYSGMGRAILMMYKATGNERYLERVTDMANFLRAALNYDEENDLYLWQYTAAPNNTTIEDLSHAAIDLGFAFLCYENGIVFEEQDFVRFANTITKNMAETPVDYTYRIDGSDGLRDLAHNLQLGRILHLSLFDKDFYHRVASMYTDMALFNTALNSASLLLGMANSNLYQNKLNPVGLFAIDDDGAKWAGAAMGKFLQNGDEVNEVITIKDYENSYRFFLYEFEEGSLVQNGWTFYLEENDKELTDLIAGDLDGDGFDEYVVGTKGLGGEIQVHELDEDESFTFLGSTAAPGTNFDWIAIAVGDFDNDNIDEFVGANKTDGQFYIYDVTGEGAVLKTSSSLDLSSSDWTSLAGGDFDNDGIDEFVAANQADGQLYIFELDNGSINLMERSSFGDNVYDWKKLTSGDYDNDGIDEFAGLNNLDSDVYFYKLQDDGEFSLVNEEGFPEGFGLAHINSGQIYSDNGNRDDFLLIRDFDHAIYIYSSTLEVEPITTSNRSIVGASNFQLVENIFPNPVGAYLNIDYVDLELIKQDNISIKIFDSLGINRLELNDVKKQFLPNIQSINVEQLGAGVYYVKIGTNDQFQVVKFVKH